MRRPEESNYFESKLGMDPRPFHTRFKSILEKKAYAESQVEQARTAWADLLAANPPASREAQGKASRRYIRAMALYQQAVDQYNKHNPDDSQAVDTDILAFGQDPEDKQHTFDGHRVKDITDERKIPLVRSVVGRPLDRAEILVIDEVSGKKSDIASADKLTLDTSPAVRRCYDLVDRDLQSGQPLKPETVLEMVKMLETGIFTRKDGSLPTGKELMRVARIEMLNLVLKRSRELSLDELSGLFNPPAPGVAGAILPPAMRNIKLADTPALREKQKQAFTALDLLPLNGRVEDITVLALQEKLASLGSKHPKVIEFLNLNDISEAQRNSLLRLVDSQHRAEESARKINAKCKDINDNRAKGVDAKGAAGEAQKALDALHAIEDWNERVSSLPAEAKESVASSVAAVETAALILDEKFDPTAQNPLADKIRKPITDASPTDARAAAAGQAAAEQAKVATEVYYGAAPGPADLSIGIAVSALSAGSHILNLPLATFQAANFNPAGGAAAANLSQGVTGTLQQAGILAVDSGRVGIQANLAADRALAPGGVLAIARTNPARADSAQFQVAAAAAIGAGVCAALPQPRTIGLNLLDRIISKTTAYYLENGNITEQAIRDHIIVEAKNEILGGGAPMPPAVTAAVGRIFQGARTGLALAEGLKAHKAQVLAAKTTITTNATTAGFSAGLAANIANLIHAAHLNGGPINRAAVDLAVNQTVDRANCVIELIRAINPVDLGLAGVQAQAAADAIKARLVAKYIADGKEINTEVATAVINEVLPNPLPAGLVLPAVNAINHHAQAGGGQIAAAGVPAMAQYIGGLAGAVGANAYPLGPLPLGQRIELPLGAEAGRFSQAAIEAYANIEINAIEAGVTATAKAAGLAEEKAKEVGKAAKERLTNNGTPAEVTQAAVKAIPKNSDPTVAVSVAAFINKNQPAAQQPVNIRNVYAQAQPVLTMATATAVGSTVATAAIKSGLPNVAAKLASDAAANAFLARGFNPAAIRKAINDSLDPTVNLTTESLHSNITAANLNFGGGVVLPPPLLDSIKDRIIAHYLEHGSLGQNHVDATRIRDEELAKYNGNIQPPQQPIPPAAGAVQVDLTTSIVVGAFTQVELGFPAHPAIPAGLIRDIQNRIISHRLKHNAVTPVAALAIINREINRYNLEHQAAVLLVQGPLAGFAAAQAAVFANFPAARTQNTVVDISDQSKEKLYRAAYKGYATTAGLQVIKQAEKDHGAAEQKDAKKAPNYREVAAAVFIGALSSEHCSLEQAQALSKRLTAHYVEHGNFDGVDPAFFRNHVNAVLPIPPAIAAQQEAVTKMVTRAAQTAAGIPPTADAVAAGTSVAAQMFPTFSSPEKAGTLAGLIAKARRKGSSPAAVGNAAAYAEGVVLKAQAQSASFASASVAAARAAQEVITRPQLFAAVHGTLQAAPAPAAGAIAVADVVLDAVLAVEAPGMIFAELSPHARDLAVTVHRAVSGVLQTVANSLQADLAGTAALANYDAALRKLEKSAAIAGHVAVNAVKQGLSPGRAEKLAENVAVVAVTNDIVAGRGDAGLLMEVHLSIAAARAEECFDAVNEIVGGFPSPNLTPHERVIVFNRGTAALPPPPENLTNKQVLAAVRLVRDEARARMTTAGAPEDIAAAAGKQAAIEFIRDVVRTRNFQSQFHLETVVTRASGLARESAHEVRSLQARAEAAAAAPGVIPPAVAARIAQVVIPPSVSAKTIAGIARSGIVANLLQTGIQAGNAAAGTPEQKALAGIAAVIRARNIPNPDQAVVTIGEALRKDATAAEMGALAAAAIPAKPEVAQALAAVTAHFMAALPADRPQAIAQATNSTVIADDRELPSGLSEVEQLRALAANEELRRKRLQAAGEACEAMQQEDELPEDLVGLSDGMKEYHLDSEVNLDASKAGEWTITFPSEDGMPPEPVKLEDIEELKETVELMKQCDGFVDAATLRIAIDQFNEGQRPAGERTGLSLKLFGPIQDRIPKNAITPKPDGGISVSLKGLSRKEIVSLIKMWAQASKLAKANSLHRPIEPEQPRNGAAPTL